MTKWITETIYSTGYFGIVFLMFVENIFPPIPSELIMPLAGFLVADGKFTFVGVILAGTIGSVLGSLPLFALGKFLGKKRLMKLANKHGRWLTVSARDVERAGRWFDKYGGWAILFCRLVPGVRSLISIPAGIAGMNLWLFLASTIFGMAVWSAILATAGYVLKSNFREVGEYLDPVSYFILGGLIVFYIYRLIIWSPNETDGD